MLGRRWMIAVTSFLIATAPVAARADVSDYLGSGADPSRCPKAIVIRPDISERNVFYSVDQSDMDTASNMIGAALSGKAPGSAVISPKELQRMKSCDVPVLLAKLKSYTRETAAFGQHQGKAMVSVLRFRSPIAQAPEKEIEISASGDRSWSDSTQFMTAIEEVCEKIQTTSF
jgi:hypothetical protein